MKPGYPKYEKRRWTKEEVREAIEKGKEWLEKHDPVGVQDSLSPGFNKHIYAVQLSGGNAFPNYKDFRPARKAINQFFAGM